MANNNKLKKKNGNINIKNKRAEFDYLVVDRYTAGIVLTGTEIKSIRAGKAGLVGEEHVCGGIRLRFLQQSCIPQGQEIAVEQKGDCQFAE